MKKLAAFWLAFGMAAAGALQAQQASPAASPVAVLPPGPLFKPVPDYTKWTVTITNKPEPNARPDQKPNVIVITGEKAGGSVHIVRTSSSGAKEERWGDGKVQVIMNPGWKVPLISRDIPAEFPIPIGLRQKTSKRSSSRGTNNS